MEYSRFLDCLAADFARLRAVVASDPAAAALHRHGHAVRPVTRPPVV